MFVDCGGERTRFLTNIIMGRCGGGGVFFSSFSFLLLATRRRSSFLAFYSFDLCLDQPTLKPPKKKR